MLQGEFASVQPNAPRWTSNTLRSVVGGDTWIMATSGANAEMLWIDYGTLLEPGLYTMSLVVVRRDGNLVMSYDFVVTDERPTIEFDQEVFTYADGDTNVELTGRVISPGLDLAIESGVIGAISDMGVVGGQPSVVFGPFNYGNASVEWEGVGGLWLDPALDGGFRLELPVSLLPAGSNVAPIEISLRSWDGAAPGVIGGAINNLHAAHRSFATTIQIVHEDVPSITPPEREFDLYEQDDVEFNVNLGLADYIDTIYLDDVPFTGWTLVNGALVIDSDYLLALGLELGDVLTLVVTFSNDTVVEIAIVVIDTTPPVINPLEQEFDLYQPGDVEFDVALGTADDIDTIYLDDVPFTGWTLVNGALVIDADYLLALGLELGDMLTLVVTFSNGAVVEVSIIVIDTTPPAINPLEQEFDVYQPEDVEFDVTLGTADDIDTIYLYGVPFTGWALVNGVLTIDADYLLALGLAAGDVLALIVTFDDGTVIELTIAVIDTFEVDKSDLEALVEYADEYDEADYTPESWAILLAALAAAQAVLDDPDATQEEVDAAYDALQAALDALVPAEQPELPVIPPQVPPVVVPDVPAAPAPDLPSFPYIPWSPGARTTEYTIYEETDDTPPYLIIYDDTPPLLAPPLSSANRLIFTAGNAEYLLNGQSRIGVGTPFIDPAFDRMMIPLRTLAEAVGIDVEWDSAARSAVLHLPTGVLILPVDEPLPDDMGMPMLVGDRAFVPLRFVMYALDKSVAWDSPNRAAVITW